MKLKLSDKYHRKLSLRFLLNYTFVSKDTQV